MKTHKLKFRQQFPILSNILSNKDIAHLGLFGVFPGVRQIDPKIKDQIIEKLAKKLAKKLFDSH